VHIDSGRGVGAPQLAAAHRIGRGCELYLVAVPETDAAIVEGFSHSSHQHKLVTDLVGANPLLIFAHA